MTHRPMISARAIAVQVLLRVLRDQAYAAAVLDAEIERHPQLDPRDRALSTELVYGVLRTHRALVAALTRHAARGLRERDYVTYCNLLVAAYQIAFLTRVPSFAAVDEAVGSIRAVRGVKVAGFANAVLRRLVSSSPAMGRRDAILANVPPWLLESLEGVLDAGDIEELVGAEDDARALPVSLRLSGDGALPAWLAHAEGGRVSPLCRRVPHSGDLRRRPGYADGAFVIQEEGAQLVSLALGVRAGDRVLDACAGRGQKTSLLVARAGEADRVWAADLHPHKLQALEGELARLRLGAPRTAAVDWTAGCGAVPEGFDRVLVDAPCTGVGTLRRRPEILLRLGPADPPRLGLQSERILRRAATRARVGGRVVYAVCSVLREEAESVVERVADVLEPAPFDAPEVHALFGTEATQFRLHPGTHGTDGFFVASFVRRRSETGPLRPADGRGFC